VHVWESHNGVSLKLVAVENRCPELAAEFEHLELLHRFGTVGLMFLLPHLLGYYESFSQLVSEMHIVKSHAAANILDPNSMYAMERVWPVPPPIAHVIRSKFFPDPFKNNEQSFIARLYLDKVVLPSQFFSHNNFPLDMYRLAELNLPFSFNQVAVDMGRLLALIHFQARLDGREIEFLMGGLNENPLVQPALYCIEFN
jgi:hypothetical protein